MSQILLYSGEMCINDARPVRYVIDAIRATDAMLCRDTSTGNNTYRRPPLWLPARRVPSGSMWYAGMAHSNKWDTLVLFFEHVAVIEEEY